MAPFKQRIVIGVLPDEPHLALDALVDTGSYYSCAPRDVLEQLGVRVMGTRELGLVDGSYIVLEIGWLMMRINGGVSPTLCAFLPEGTEPVLGALTLEEFQLAADPVNGRLIPMRPVPGHRI